MMAAVIAYPLTPFRSGVVDQNAFIGLVKRAAEARVDAITVLGSTGGYAYLGLSERMRLLRIAIDAAGAVPVYVGIGTPATRDVVALAVDAEKAGAAGGLLAPVSYQPLTRDEVSGLYEDVTGASGLPLIVYDNPRTTGFSFDDPLLASVAALPGVTGIKTAGVSDDPGVAAQRYAALREIVPKHVAVGFSGDAFAAASMIAGYEVWHSVLAGVLPGVALDLASAVSRGDGAHATVRSAALASLWALNARHAGMRTSAAIAEHLGIAAPDCLPRPLLGLSDDERREWRHSSTRSTGPRARPSAPRCPRRRRAGEPGR
ncbi:dihydrodipicolinate synthase family protein [Demequina litorisediminis]|uniref:Dihydrodipicolinate synthase family protein n=1 Tax=Demequina litorisediminis TaxID=1849022 RepID=A0ABQ6IAE7_9MICO|nr:dihydrodipicolinate synthase family protein [Demequina litorisediminis]GMA34624.1 dihydrodipicolinate synthase family protein [Demequina litorisediminis]